MVSRSRRLFLLMAILSLLIPAYGHAGPSLEWVDFDEGMQQRIINSKVYLENVESVYGYFHHLLKDLSRACSAREIRIRHLETKAYGLEDNVVLTFLVFITSTYGEKRIFTVHYSEDPGLWREKIRRAFLRDEKAIDGETCLWVSSAVMSVADGKAFREMGEADLVKLLEQKVHPESMTGSTQK